MKEFFDWLLRAMEFLGTSGAPLAMAMTMLFVVSAGLLLISVRRTQGQVHAELLTCRRDRKRDHTYIFGLSTILVQSLAIIRAMSGGKRTIPPEFYVLEESAERLFEDIKRRGEEEDDVTIPNAV